MSLLSIEDLHVTYQSSRGPISAVNGVSLELDAGHTLGIAGESGSGKSTVAHAVLRLNPRSARIDGHVRVCGDDVNCLNWGALRRMRWADAAMVFQGAMNSLNPVQTIGEQVAEPVTVHQPATTRREADRRVGALLDMVGLPGQHAHVYPHTLSGGQKQRVMIAMALACDPKLLVADEPTTALDVKVQAQIMTLLESLTRDLGLGLMLISHDLAMLSSVCDDVVVMHGGRVVEKGSGADLFAHARHPYTQSLAGAFPTIGDPDSRYRPHSTASDSPESTATVLDQAFVDQCELGDPDCLIHRREFARYARGREVPCLQPHELGLVPSEMDGAR